MTKVTDVLGLVTVIRGQLEDLRSRGSWLGASSSFGHIGQLSVICQALHVLIPKVVRVIQVFWDGHLESFFFWKVSYKRRIVAFVNCRQVKRLHIAKHPNVE